MKAFTAVVLLGLSLTLANAAPGFYLNLPFKKNEEALKQQAFDDLFSNWQDYFNNYQDKKVHKQDDNEDLSIKQKMDPGQNQKMDAQPQFNYDLPTSSYDFTSWPYNYYSYWNQKQRTQQQGREAPSTVNQRNNRAKVMAAAIMQGLLSRSGDALSKAALAQGGNEELASQVQDFGELLDNLKTGLGDFLGRADLRGLVGDVRTGFGDYLDQVADNLRNGKK